MYLVWREAEKSSDMDGIQAPYCLKQWKTKKKKKTIKRRKAFARDRGANHQERKFKQKVVDKEHSGGEGGGKLWPLIDENLWKEFLLLVADTAENC